MEEKYFESLNQELKNKNIETKSRKKLQITELNSATQHESKSIRHPII